MRNDRNRLLIMFFAALMLLCTACQPANVPVSTDGETKQSEDGETTEPASVEKIEEGEGVKLQPVTYNCHIKELDVTLAIHESLYVYQIDGIYLDWTGELNAHSFSRWTIVTDKEYNEAILAETLCENYQEEVPHILFAVSTTPEEFFPARRLCYGLFQDTEVRVSGDQYCEVLDTRKIVRTNGRFGDYSKVGAMESAERWNEWTEKWVDCIEAKTSPTKRLYGALDAVFRPAGLEIGDENLYRMTFADDGFWEVYIETVDQLQFSPEAYTYYDEVVRTLIRETEGKATQGDGENGGPAEIPVVIYADSREDIYIRAYYYAKYVRGKMLSDGVLAETGQPDDFVVILQDWENGQRSFITYRKTDSGEYQQYGGGYDYFNNLYGARRYVQGKDMDQEPLEFTVELTSYPDRYVICMEGAIEEKNGEFILRGEKVYGGDIVIDFKQKALLDAGARMIVCLEGEELFTVDAVVLRAYGGEVAYYRDVEKYEHVLKQDFGRIMTPIIIHPFENSRMDTVEPRVGEFKLKNISSAEYMLVLEEKFELTVPADTPVYPYYLYLWPHANADEAEISRRRDAVEPIPMSEYANRVSAFYLYGIDMTVYAEDGKIVRIEEEY